MATRVVEAQGVADPFDREVEAWIDRLEREFREVDPVRPPGVTSRP